MLAKQIYEIALDNNPGTPRFHGTCKPAQRPPIDPPAIVTAKWASACQFTTAPA